MRSPCPQNRTERKLPERTYSEPWWSEVAQSCPTPCDPLDWSPPGSSVHRILQARVLEWVAISSSKTLIRAPFSLVLRAEGEFPTERASTNGVKLVRDGGERTVTQDLKCANKNDGVSSSSPVGRACSLHHRRLTTAHLVGYKSRGKAGWETRRVMPSPWAHTSTVDPGRRRKAHSGLAAGLTHASRHFTPRTHKVQLVFTETSHQLLSQRLGNEHAFPLACRKY